MESYISDLSVKKSINYWLMQMAEEFWANYFPQGVAKVRDSPKDLFLSSHHKEENFSSYFPVTEMHVYF